MKFNHKIGCLFFLGLWLFSIDSSAQRPVDMYVAEGFKNNIVVQQKNISLEQAQNALKIAKALYLPTVAFSGNWSTASGGRNIPLPLGDLMNPVYATLNQLTQTNKFATLENESINFLPKNYYDAKVRATVPIYNAEIGYNKLISEKQVLLQEYELSIYKRDLVRSIKTAFYNYQNALQAIEIYQSGLKLVEEGLRVNEKLVDAGKGLPAYVLRSKSEVENAKAKITEAQQQLKNAQLYFNFLLNRDAESDIKAMPVGERELNEADVLITDLFLKSGREEIKAMGQVIDIHKTVLKMNKQFALPKLAAFADLGSQSEGFKFNSNTRYYMLGLQLDIPIFAGNRNNLKIKQSNLELKNAELNANLTSAQLNLSVKTAQNNLRSAYQNYLSSEKQFEAVDTYQRLIEKGYRAGTNTFIETIDARNQYTSAKILVNINRYKVLSAMADLERETATYEIN